MRLLPLPKQAQADAPVGNAGAAFLASLGGCMTSLSLGGRSALTAGGLGFLGGWARLERLDLRGVQLGQGDAAFLWQLTRITCLLLGGSKARAQAAGRGREGVACGQWPASLTPAWLSSLAHPSTRGAPSSVPP